MTLSILQWNMRGFFAQEAHLQSALPLLQPTVLALQETHLRPHHTPCLPGYTSPATRKDRLQRKGGGVALFVQLQLPYTDLLLDSTLEAVALQLHLPGGPVTLCSLYLSPDVHTDDLPALLTTLLTQLPAPLVLLSDANAHHHL